MTSVMSSLCSVDAATHEEEAKLAVLGWPVKQEYGVVMMSGMSGYLSDFP